MPIRKHIALLSVCLFALSIGSQMARSQEGASVTGYVRDIETSGPIEGAIVFVISTTVGVSTQLDGSFRISNLQPGPYELVASRVGYERTTIALAIQDTGSTRIVMLLKPKPIQTKGVDVFAKGEESNGSPFYFYPGTEVGQYCVFPSGYAQPIGVLFTDSAFYMYSVNVVVRDSQQFLCLWLLYQNNSEYPRFIQPRAELSLKVKDETHQNPSKISPLLSAEALHLTTVDESNRESRDKIGGAIGKLLEYQQRIRPGSFHTLPLLVDAAGGTISDASGVMVVQPDVQKSPAGIGLSSEYLSATFQGSFHAGILGKYLVYPHNTIDGLVYFPLAGNSTQFFNSTGPLIAHLFVFDVELNTPNGVKELSFHAN